MERNTFGAEHNVPRLWLGMLSVAVKRSGRRGRPEQADPRALASRARTALRGLPASLWVVQGLFLALLALYATLAPTYQAPDEPHHVDLAMASARGQTLPWPEPMGRENSLQVQRSLRPYEEGTVWDQRWSMRLPEAPPRSERPTFAEFGPDVPSGQPNQMPQHPPLYYYAAGVWLKAGAFESQPFDRVAGWQRLLSMLLVAPLPLFAYLTTRRLCPDERVALAAATVVLAVPQLLHIGSVASNDSLLIALLGLLTVPVAFVATGDLRLRTAGVAGFVAGLALLTKGFALAVYAWLPVAYAVAIVRTRRIRRGLLAGSAALAVATAVGGWWWLRNQIVHGMPQPAGRVEQPAPAGFTPEGFTAYLDFFVRHFTRRFWGSFGWLEVSLSWSVVTAAALVLLVGLIAAFLFQRQGDAFRQLDILLLVLPTLAILGIVLSGAWESYQRTGQHHGVQGRYVLPGVVGLASAVAIGYGSMLRFARSWLPLAALVFAGSMNLVAGKELLRGFWMQPGSLDVLSAIRAWLAWTPWPPLLTLMVAALVLVLSSALVVCLSVVALRVQAAPAPEPAVVPD